MGLSGNSMGLYECSLGPQVGRGMQATSPPQLSSWLSLASADVPASQGKRRSHWPSSRKQSSSLGPPQRPAILGEALIQVFLTSASFTHVPSRTLTS